MFFFCQFLVNKLSYNTIRTVLHKYLREADKLTCDKPDSKQVTGDDARADEDIYTWNIIAMTHF